MSMPAATTPHLGGRPREFDPEATLMKIVDLFWRTGYKEASIAEIEKATGVVRTSLYHHFGSKQAMFAAALAAYYDSVGTQMRAVLTEGEQGLASVDAFLAALSAQLTDSAQPDGCLVLSSVDDIVGIDELKELPSQYIATFREALGTALTHAEAQGNLQSGSAERRADMLSATIIGINVAHRAGKGDRETAEALANIREEVASWSLASVHVA